MTATLRLVTRMLSPGLDVDHQITDRFPGESVSAMRVRPDDCGLVAANVGYVSRNVGSEPPTVSSIVGQKIRRSRVCHISISGRYIYRPRWADLYTVRNARDRILRLLAQAPDGAALSRFLPDVPDEGTIAIPAALRRRAGWTSTFLASLELAKQGDVALAQEGLFAPILVCKVPGAAATYFAEAACLDEIVS
jgi:hypothetical protein